MKRNAEEFCNLKQTSCTGNATLLPRARSCHGHSTRPALATATACALSRAKPSRATTHCLWFWCLWFLGPRTTVASLRRSTTVYGPRSMGTACKFRVVDFISLQRTIRKICTLCPRKILFFFSAASLPLAASLLAIVIAVVVRCCCCCCL